MLRKLLVQLRKDDLQLQLGVVSVLELDKTFQLLDLTATNTAMCTRIQ